MALTAAAAAPTVLLNAGTPARMPVAAAGMLGRPAGGQMGDLAASVRSQVLRELEAERSERRAALAELQREVHESIRGLGRDLSEAQLAISEMVQGQADARGVEAALGELRQDLEQRTSSAEAQGASAAAVARLEAAVEALSATPPRTSAGESSESASMLDTLRFLAADVERVLSDFASLGSRLARTEGRLGLMELSRGSNGGVSGSTLADVTTLKFQYDGMQQELSRLSQELVDERRDRRRLADDVAQAAAATIERAERRLNVEFATAQGKRGHAREGSPPPASVLSGGGPMLDEVPARLSRLVGEAEAKLRVELNARVRSIASDLRAEVSSAAEVALGPRLQRFEASNLEPRLSTLEEKVKQSFLVFNSLGPERQSKVGSRLADVGTASTCSEVSAPSAPSAEVFARGEVVDLSSLPPRPVSPRHQDVLSMAAQCLAKSEHRAEPPRRSCSPLSSTAARLRESREASSARRLALGPGKSPGGLDERSSCEASTQMSASLRSVSAGGFASSLMRGLDATAIWGGQHGSSTPSAPTGFVKQPPAPPGEAQPEQQPPPASHGASPPAQHMQASATCGALAALSSLARGPAADMAASPGRGGHSSATLPQSMIRGRTVEQRPPASPSQHFGLRGSSWAYPSAPAVVGRDTLSPGVAASPSFPAWGGSSGGGGFACQRVAATGTGAGGSVSISSGNAFPPPQRPQQQHFMPMRR
mmetsp:Transcript_110213/g.351268  ORF Transcript_110213/g.351268 Transcript_110213/m.351268 type:complete len:711 (-) Transcript_110213:93-2225(-)